MINTLKSLSYFLPKYQIENKLISLELDKKNSHLDLSHKDTILSKYIIHTLSNISNDNLKFKWANQLSNKEHILFSLISLKYWKSTEVMLKYLNAKNINLENNAGESLFYVLSKESLDFNNISENFVYQLIVDMPSLKLNAKQYFQFYKSAIETHNHVIMNAILKYKFNMLDNKTQVNMKQEIFNIREGIINESILKVWMNYFWQEKDEIGNNIFQHILTILINNPFSADAYAQTIQFILTNIEFKDHKEKLNFLENKNKLHESVVDMIQALIQKDNCFHQRYSHIYDKVLVEYEKSLFNTQLNNNIEHKPIKKVKI